jgi:hypothetical protein
MNDTIEAPTRTRQGSIVAAAANRIRLWCDSTDRSDAFPIHPHMLDAGTTRMSLRPGSAVEYDLNDDDRPVRIRLLGR